MLENPKLIVQRGYDQLGSLYRAFYEKANSARYNDWLTALVRLLPKEADVLELGCADGIPTASLLSQHVNYLGIDISPVQIELARANVPQARFEPGDMAGLTFPDHSFDGIVALYSIIHIPLAEQPPLLKAIYLWLRPGGYFLCVVGSEEWTGTDPDWITPGTNMYWSHTDVATYQSWFTKTGFTCMEKSFVAEADGGHTYFLLQK